MSKSIQIVVDSQGSLNLAKWWADADIVRVGDKLSWNSGAAINSGEESRPRQRMYFQDVPEQKVVKNRMHIDVHVGPEVLTETVEQLTARGASRVGTGSQSRHNWIIIADPEGNEFCVS